MMTARAAETYEPVEDLWLVACYFNPAEYKIKAQNYAVFRDAAARSHLHLLTVECAFGNDPFMLPPAPDVLHVRASDVMWQKERLLNLAVARLPRRCTKIAWLDCDVLFENPRWAVETSRLLDHYPVVQPFATAIRLPSGTRDYCGEGEVLPSFAAVCAANPETAREGDYEKHGETGLAWAARRDVIAAVGLYDASIIGGGDHLIAHASCGDWSSPCITGLLGAANPHRDHYVRWAEVFYRHVQARIECVAGSALHLWHGDKADRRYFPRHRELESFGFDPEKDLRIGACGCWEWASHKVEMHRWAADYFFQRKEDGHADPAGAASAERAASEVL
jgi:hypothetical protein